MFDLNKSLKDNKSGREYSIKISLREEQEEVEITQTGSDKNSPEERNLMSGNSRENGQPNDQCRKRIRRIKQKDLLAHLAAANEAQANQLDRSRRHELPAQPILRSPNNQNLSYFQQQQLQRTGGLQRLTADLAGLQFTDTESPLISIGRQASLKRQSGRQVINQQATAPLQATDGSNGSANIEQSGGISGGGYEEQMVLSSCSQSKDLDPSKDIQETNEDAAFLKRFRILGLIGTGNYARVYKAISSQGRELAIKAINLSKTSENYRTKFLPRELTILKRISHVNICKTHEIMQVADRIFIVMQFCSHGTIADLLHKLGPLSEPVARDIFVQTVDAITYMHSIDLAHRDLKVENILLDQDFCPKLTDFSYSVYICEKQSSLSKKSHKSNSSKQLKNVQSRSPIKLSETFCGTLPYLSPEMIRQTPYDSKKTDVWSLGVCLYVTLNDRLPFPFNDIRLMVKKQMTRDYKFKAHSEFSDQLKDLISLMLEPEFSKRLTSQEVRGHVWMNGPREKPSPT